MPTSGLGDDEIADLRRAFAGCGGNVRETARRTGRSREAIRRYCVYQPDARPAGPTDPAPGPTKADVADMRASAERYVQPEDDDDPPEVVWRREEERSARRIRKAAEGHTFSWRAPGPHLLLAFVADHHIAPGTPVDFRRMREDAELIAATPHCYAVLGGDGVDNHIKHRAAVLAARSQPEDQYRLFEYYLSILGDRVLLMISGNHEAWTNQIAGVDVLGRIARDRRVWYAPDEGRLDVSVGRQTYSVAVRHQYRMNSSFNQTHAVKQWLRLGEREFDIGCVGHHHEHALESFVYRGKLRWGCRPGSYQVTSAYSRQYGFNRSLPTTPAFLLAGDEHEVTGWPTLGQAVRSVRTVRELGVA